MQAMASARFGLRGEKEEQRAGGKRGEGVRKKNRRESVEKA